MAETREVYKAINAITAALAAKGIAKHAPKPSSKVNYDFRGIDDIYNALAPLLAEHQLCILPNVLDRQCQERQSNSGGALFYVTVQVEFDFVSAGDGSTHKITTIGEAMDVSDKATNKAMSAAYKYAAMMAFCIPTVGEDSENDTHEVIRLPDVPPFRRVGTLAGQVQKKLGDGSVHDDWKPPPGPSLIPFGELSPYAWAAQRFIPALKTAANLSAIENWHTYNSTNLATLMAQFPRAHTSVMTCTDQLRQQLGGEMLEESGVSDIMGEK